MHRVLQIVKPFILVEFAALAVAAAIFWIVDLESTKELPWPRWFVLAILAAYPGWCLLRWLRRLKRGHPKCGYDLTGNVSGVCPECGKAT